MDTAVSIRKATILDMPACAGILNRWIDETPWMPRIHDPEDVVRHYREIVFSENDVSIAVSDETPVAFIALSTDSFVTALYVDAENRGKRLGHRLLETAKTVSPQGLSLWTFVANEHAQRFYAQAGFVEARRTPGENEERLPDILLRWTPEAIA